MSSASATIAKHAAKHAGRFAAKMAWKRGRRLVFANPGNPNPNEGVTYADFARTGHQDCDNVLDFSEFDIKPDRTPKQIVAATFERWEEDGDLERFFVEDWAGDFGDLDPHRAYVAWKREWMRCAEGHIARRQAQNADRHNPASSRTSSTAGRLVVKRERASSLPKQIVISPEAAARAAAKLISSRAYEVFLILYLDYRNQVLGYEELTEDSFHGVSVNVPSVIRNALLAGALGIVTAHNHPSGVVDPSSEDRNIWRELREAAKAMSIVVLDNLVIGDRVFYSEADDKTGRL